MAIMRKLVKKPILGACVHSKENILDKLESESNKKTEI